MKQKQTIESRVADAILEKSVGKIEICGKTYNIAPPSVATLILVSEIVSRLPIVSDTADDSAKTLAVLHYAKDYKELGDIAAVLLLGAKAIKEDEQRVEQPRKWYSFFRKKKTATRREELANLILENVPPSVLFECIIKRLRDNEVGIFFLITTSLSGANLLKPTKEVGEH